MQQSIAYHNGQFVAESDLRVRPQDLGFMWGVTVAEQLRTFRGNLFQLNEHLHRLNSSLNTVGIDVDENSIWDAAKRVIEHNYALIDPSSDLGLTVFVTPGLSPTYFPDSIATPNVGIHSYPLPFALWHKKYSTGQVCEFSRIPQVSADCWPRGLKSRSRMHYYLADQEVKARSPAARAILLDDKGYVNEASTANVVAYFPNEGLVSPPTEDILPGISLRYVEFLATEHGEAFSYRKISAAELETAEEIFLTSTPFCLLPISRIGERGLVARDQFEQLLARWSDRVGVQIESQATAHGS